jgi:hypothetical protein
LGVYRAMRHCGLTMVLWSRIQNMSGKRGRSVSGASIRLRARAIWKTTGKHLNPEANADHVRPRRCKNATTRDQTERQLYDSTAKKLAATHICYILRELGLEHNLLCSLYDCKLRAGDLIILSLPDFRPESHEVTFKP